MVPENIHTPTTEGIGIPEAQEIPERSWVVNELHFQMVKFDAVMTYYIYCSSKIASQLPTLQTLYIEKIISQVFDTRLCYILNRFSFSWKHTGS